MQKENLVNKTALTPTIKINNSPNIPQQQTKVFNNASDSFATSHANEESCNKGIRSASSMNDTDIILLTSNKENVDLGILNAGEYVSDNKTENNNNTLNLNNNFNTNKAHSKIRRDYTDTSSLPL